MSTPNDGGPAFPFACQGPTTAPEFYYGMTVRDYMAGQALAGICANPEGYESIRRCAEGAYTLADAMLAVREGKG